MPLPPNKIDSPALQARDIFFRKINISLDEMTGAFSQPLVLLFFGLVTAVFLVINQGNVFINTSIWTAGLVWTVTILVQVILFIGACITYAQVQSRFRLPRLYLPLVSLAAFSISIPLGIYHASLHLGGDFVEAFRESMILNSLILGLIFEALYFSFVFPLMRATNKILHSPPTRKMNVAGKVFDIEDIITLRGQEHYVLITTLYGTHKLRARLGDLVSQTQEKDGILAHRSHWVSRNAIKGITCENGGEFIVTNTGEHMPIARPRQARVRDWAEKFAV